MERFRIYSRVRNTFRYYTPKNPAKWKQNYVYDAVKKAYVSKRPIVYTYDYIVVNIDLDGGLPYLRGAITFFDVKTTAQNMQVFRDVYFSEIMSVLRSVSSKENLARSSIGDVGSSESSVSQLFKTTKLRLGLEEKYTTCQFEYVFLKNGADVYSRRGELTYEWAKR